MAANRRRIPAGTAPGGTARGDFRARGRTWGVAVALVLVLGSISIAARGSETAARSRGRAEPSAVRRPDRDRDRAPARRVDLSKVVLPSDDWTFRPTVIVRRGTSQGSGTIIASIAGETLVLTAAHVVRDHGPIVVELHRYNLGMERVRPAPGAWPRPVRAFVAATDPAADLAILRIEELAALPYVARLAPVDQKLALDTLVTSIGIDLGVKLSSWNSRLVETLWFELNDSHDERLFFITAQPPEHGRSGGGLFLDGGELVGVCVGHAELVRGRRMGVFASSESIRQLLLDHRLDTVVALSELRRAQRQQNNAPRASRRAASTNAPAPRPAAVTTTHAVGERGR